MSEHFEGGSADQLQVQLRDLLCLAVVGDHVRWVLSGVGTDDVAAWLASAVAGWRASADAVARQLAESGTPPDGRVRALAQDLPWNWVPDGWLTGVQAQDLMTERVGRVAEFARARHDESTPAKDRQLFGVLATGLEAEVAQLSRLRPRGIAG